MSPLCTALRKMLTALSPAEVSEQVLENGVSPRTQHTLVVPARMRQELARVRTEFAHVDLGLGGHCCSTRRCGSGSPSPTSR
jgi:DNA-binding IclR family transcriptional regulator